MMRDYHDWKIDYEDVKRRTTSTNGHLMHGNTYCLRNKLSRETVYVRGDSEKEDPHVGE